MSGSGQCCQLYESAPDQKARLNSNRSEENVIKQTNQIEKKDKFAVCRIRRMDVPHFLSLVGIIPSTAVLISYCFWYECKKNKSYHT